MLISIYGLPIFKMIRENLLQCSLTLEILLIEIKIKYRVLLPCIRLTGLKLLYCESLKKLPLTLEVCSHRGKQQALPEPPRTA